LHLFLSPTLLRCALPPVHSVFHSELKSIATRCPALESLSIHTSRAHTADELSLLSDIIRSYKQLVTLGCPHLDFAAWKHLSILPTLLTLNIHECKFHQPMDWDRLYFARFLNLTTLDFTVQESADIITVLQHSEFPSLKMFKMDVAVLPFEKAQELFRALTLCKACETLEGLEIYSHSPDYEELSDMPLTSIRQFLCFSRLRILGLNVCHIYLDNDILLEAMSSWPHIRCLDIHYHDHHDHHDRLPPLVTFSGLFAALRTCPHLRTLKLPVDAVNIDIDPDAESFRHNSLQTLDVCNSSVQDPYTVARIVSSMLPSIEFIVSCYSNLVFNPWHQVNNFLEEFAMLVGPY
jgi:hypothetical protein